MVVFRIKGKEIDANVDSKYFKSTKSANKQMDFLIDSDSKFVRVKQSQEKIALNSERTFQRSQEDTLKIKQRGREF